MKKENKILSLVNNLLIFNTVIFVTYIIGQLILNHFGLQFRAAVNVICLGGVFLIYVAGIIIKCIITKNMKLYMAIISAVFLVFTIIVASEGMAVVLFIDNIPHKEYVVEIDGYKFVGYESDALDVFIDFYDYKNALVSGNKRRFTAHGHRTDENGNIVFYDDMYDFYHLDDIYGIDMSGLEMN